MRSVATAIRASGRPVFRASALAAACAVVAACTHKPFADKAMHFSTFKVPPPKGSTVYVCHAYGCRTQTKIKFGEAELATIKKIMKKTRKDDSAAEERRAVAYAIGWMERHVGRITGTKADRAGMDFIGSGDPSQQDCVDEATNTTSYLTVLQNNNVLRHHTVGTPFAKENYLRGIAGWTHWTAVLRETATGEDWAVDSWIYKNGENPAVVNAKRWYISSLENLPKATR
ncbi:MAG: hypothetical protein AAFQ45_12405 [Pseudomonadota bacterium]